MLEVIMRLLTRTTDGAAAKAIVSEPALCAIMWVGVATATAFTALRTCYQYRTNRRLYSNDYFILAAMVFHLANAICYQFMIPAMYRLEFPTKALDAEYYANAAFFLRLQFATDLLLWSTEWLVKFSLLFFFWRLFELVETRMRIFWYIMVFVTGATYCVAVILQMFACHPLSKFFYLGGCSTQWDIYHSVLVFQFSVGTDIGVDVLVMFIPFPLLWKLQINTHQRNILLGVFLLPIIPIIFASLRLAASNPTRTFLDPIRFQFFSMLENNTTIIVAALPSLRLFFTKRRTGNTSDGYKNSYGRGNVPYHHDLTDTLNGHKGRIPLQTVVKSENGQIRRANRNDSSEEILHKGHWGDVRVERDFIIEEHGKKDWPLDGI